MPPNLKSSCQDLDESVRLLKAILVAVREIRPYLCSDLARAMPRAAWARPTTGATIWRSSGSSTPLPPGFRMPVPQYGAKRVSVAQRGAIPSNVHLML